MGVYRELQEAVAWMIREKFKGQHPRMRVPMPSTVTELLVVAMKFL